MKPVQHNHLSLIYLFDNIQFSLLTALLCRSCSSCCTHYFDSMISILRYHHAAYHLIYSASPPCSKTQRLLSVLFKDKTKHREYTRTHAYVDIYTYIHISWHTYSGDESSESCSLLKAMEFRISLVLRGHKGKVNLLLKSRGSWRKFPRILVSIYTLHPHQA